MAWTTPGTAVSGGTFTSTQYNSWVRDNMQELNPLDTVAVASWVPALEADSVDPTYSSTGRYWRAGPVVFAWARIIVTASAGTGEWFVTLPVTSSDMTVGTNIAGAQSIGTWHARDHGTPANNTTGSVQLRTADEVIFIMDSASAIEEANPFAWATDDVLSFFVVYPAA